MSKRRAADEPQYVPDQSMSVQRRAAHFLDWAATHHPMRFFTAAELWQRIMVLPKLPRETDLNRKAVSNVVSRARHTLQELYGRTVVTQRGLGFRASVGSEDVNDNCLPRRLRGAKSALASLEVAAEFVKAADLPPEKREHFETVSATLTRLRRGKFIEQLTQALALPEHVPSDQETSS